MPCTRCGECCGTSSAYVCRTSKATKESVEYEKFLEFTRPKIFARAPDGVIVKAPCEHLGSGNVCRVYETRPTVCREFLCHKARDNPIPEAKDRTMKLGNVFTSREAWQRLTALRMPPKTAYRLLKYSKTVDAEMAVVEQERVKLLREASGIEQGEICIEPGTPEHAAFVGKFTSWLETDSDLKPLEMKMDELIGALESEQGNVLSAADLGALEPFFTE